MVGSEDDSGLLGNLPNHRPGVESPRRAEARKRAAARERAATPAPDSVEAPGGPGASGFEQLARAGAGLAGGAAAVGLRLAGRAAGEIGKVVGRR